MYKNNLSKIPWFAGKIAKFQRKKNFEKILSHFNIVLVFQAFLFFFGPVFYKCLTNYG